MFGQLLINTLIVGSGYALIAMAFRLLFSVSPFFNMTIGTVATIVAYSTYLFVNVLQLPIFIAIILSLLIASLLSYLFEILAYQPFRKHGASSMILLVVSLGLYTMFESFIHLGFGPQYQTLGNITDVNMINILGQKIPTIQAISIFTSFIVFGFLYCFLHRTFLGKQIRSINDNQDLANIYGMQTQKIIAFVSLLAGLILGMAGILVGYDTGMEPTMGFNLMFKGMIGAIIGGMGHLRGAFFGAMFLAFAENLGVWVFASEWRDAVAFTLFIIFLYIKPNGIFQKKKGK